MTRFALVASCLLSLVSFAAAAPAPNPATPNPAATKPALPKLSGPYKHANLTLFFIHGPDTMRGDYLTLEEAMRDKKVIVYETSNVNELAVENRSDRPVYLQSGEIVKGGKQDRSLANDLVLAPRSPKVPIAAFCVEHGRWQQRGAESAGAFSSSSEAVAGAKMKLAAQNLYKDGGGQQKVWDEAAANQTKLGRRVSADVAASASPSSFQLTLEDKNVQAEVDKYIANIKPMLDKYPDAIGYAVAINGKLACADSYGSNMLFRKLWPKLLKSAAVEAAAEFDPKAKTKAATAEDIGAALVKAEAGKRSTTQISDRVYVSSFDADDSILFETRDTSTGSASARSGYLHRNYLRKD